MYIKLCIIRHKISKSIGNFWSIIDAALDQTATYNKLHNIMSRVYNIYCTIIDQYNTLPPTPSNEITLFIRDIDTMTSSNTGTLPPEAIILYSSM